MRTLSAGLFAIAMTWMFAPAASANAIYTFSGNIGAPGGGIASIGISVTDAIANGGSLNFDVTGGGGFGGCDPATHLNCFITGDPTGFVSLTEFNETFAFPNNILGHLNLNFSVSGGVASGHVIAFGALTDLNAGFGPAGLSGTIASDNLPCFGFNPCQITPLASSVPEPSTFAVVLAAIAALFAMVRTGLLFRRTA
jgi:hypothetical protein